MGFWSKLGKIGLAAAPYVAAPFTGGASLYFAPAANAALKKWNEKDAQKAAAQGLGPSNFDKYVGLGSDVAGGIGASGALGGKMGGVFGGKSQPQGWQSALGGIVGQYAGQQIGNLGNRAGTPQNAMNYGGGGGDTYARPRGYGNIFENQMYHQLGPVMGQLDQSNPNLAASIGAGRLNAIRNQPFRSGYDVRTLGNDDETVITSRTPPIYPGGGRGRRRNNGSAMASAEGRLQ